MGCILDYYGFGTAHVYPRVLPLMLFSKIQIPVWLMRWLEYVPVAVMASLIGQELFMSGSRLVPLQKMRRYGQHCLQWL